MSASNWTNCPQCESNKKKAITKLKDVYGKVTQEEYEILKDTLKQNEDEDSEKNTLREDYEQGVNNDGTVYMYYSCGCDSCGFDKDFKFDESTHIIVDQNKKED